MARPPIVDLQVFPSLTPAAARPWASDALPREAALNAAALTRMAQATSGTDRLDDLPVGLVQLLQAAEGAGIDMIAVGAVALGTSNGEFRVITNDALLDALQTSPSRLLAFPEANPRRGAPVLADLDRWCAQPGVAGCVLTPRTWGRLPLDDPYLLFPIYERCQASGRAAMIQGGFAYPDPDANQRSDQLARVALAFPDLQLLIADIHGALTDAVIAAASLHPNIHVVLSGWLSLLIRESPALAWLELERLRVRVGAGRLLWGSGWPFAQNMSETVQSLLRGTVPASLREGGVRAFTEPERRAILGGNAAALFGLPAIEDAPTAEGPYNGRIVWTPEAEVLLKQVPGIFRSKGRSAVEEYARERGQPVITVEIMAEVRRALLGF